MVEVVEALIRLLKTEFHAGTVLVAPDELFEVKNPPSVTLHGPKIQENTRRRTCARFFHREVETMTFEAGAHPRLFHLDFELVVTCSSERELLRITEDAHRFFARFSELTVADKGVLPITFSNFLGSVNRVNRSNLRQATGRLRVEDCPVYDGQLESGHLIREQVITFAENHL